MRSTSAIRTATKDADVVTNSIRKALQTALAAQKEAYGDVRSSSALCTDHLDVAVKSLEAASHWMAEYQKEEKADERRSEMKPKGKAVEKFICHSCENDIDSDNRNSSGDRTVSEWY